MNKIIIFYKNNILEIWFVLGLIALYTGYYFWFASYSEPQAKFLTSASIFILEFFWMLIISLCTKTSETLVKIGLLNLPAVVSLVIMCSLITGPYVHKADVIPFIIMVGVVSFLFSWICLAAFIRYKELPIDDEIR